MVLGGRPGGRTDGGHRVVEAVVAPVGFDVEGGQEVLGRQRGGVGGRGGGH